MATRRIFAGPGAVYHCMTRTVNREKLFDDAAKEMLRRHIHQVAAFCGVEVITFAIMSNHFHILLKVPEPGPVSDAELMRRYRILYPKPTKHATAHVCVLEEILEANGAEAEQLRRRLLNQMGDLAAFMKLLKQHFSHWFNRMRRRCGTLWSERYTSVVVEGTPFSVKTVAAYIDLNPVRAGLCADPAGYRFCGYGEMAAAGRCGDLHLCHAVDGPAGMTDGEMLDSYRQSLFAKGATGKRDGTKAAKLSLESADRVGTRRGKLTLPERLRLRVAWFTQGAVIGSKLFVETRLAEYRLATGRRSRSSPNPRRRTPTGAASSRCVTPAGRGGSLMIPPASASTTASYPVPPTLADPATWEFDHHRVSALSRTEHKIPPLRNIESRGSRVGAVFSKVLSWDRA